MSITINPPAGPWTVDDLENIPNEGLRFEIHEGNLLVMSPATRWHSRISRRIANALEAAGHDAEMEVGVKRSKTNTRVADVGVFAKPTSDSRRAHWEPSELEIVIEVVSDSSEGDDRAAKPTWYAAAGIPHFWRVERTDSDDDDDAIIFQHTLATTAAGESAYVQTAVTTLSALEAIR